MVWSRTRAALPASTLWSALITFFLVFTIARSTVAASWVVYGIDAAPPVALFGAVLMAVLAVTPLPWYVCVAVGMALGPVVAAVESAPAFAAFHPQDPGGLAAVQVWLQRVQDGSAFGDTAFVLFVITWLMWVTGAWLAWCVLRWRQPLIGLIPGAAAFSTNVLNYPDNQNGYTLAFLVLTFALLLWTNYTGSVAKAVRARVRLTGDAKWDFWESGLVATAGLIVLAIMLPPLSTIDRTTTMESSLFSTWAQLQQQLNHPADSTSGTGTAAGTTGFSPDVKLGGELKKSTTPVFTYTQTGQWIGPKYFRGVNAIETVGGEWRYEPTVELKQAIPRGQAPNYAETYQASTFATFTVTMVNPPAGYADILFYPGQMAKADRDSVASETLLPPPGPGSPLDTIDRLSSRSPASSKGGYSITSEYPNAFEADLRTAGIDYPSWLTPYMSLSPSGYRPPEVLAMERDLALQITSGTTNPYDAATAIQDYLRAGPFTYTLKPGNPVGDPIDYFLNTSHRGYCEYFATAMGDMLRLLRIPTRLVNGYGQGTFDAAKSRYVVTGADAHTWVEVYFPGYGWIPFEPTPDPNYSPIHRGDTSGSNLCINDTLCGVTSAAGGSTASPTPRDISRAGGNQQAGGSAGGAGGGLRVPDAGTLTRIVGVILALMLIVAAIASRYLRPRTVMGVWRRTLVLARLAGAAILPGETPLEMARRLSRVFPEMDAPVRALAGGFVVAAYAPPESAQGARTNVMEAWAQLRPLMLKRLAGRFGRRRH